MKRALFGLIGAFLFLHPAAIFAQRYITGELSGVYPADDYVITGNIHVLPRTTLRFEPGSTLRFENFTGIIVRGELICKGTILRPIKFTSSRDLPTSRIMPEAFDWNGIKVMPEASTICLEHCTISYSTSGIEVASDATPVILAEVTFFRNGSASLTRQREMITVEDNMPVSYRWPKIKSENPGPVSIGERSAVHEPLPGGTAASDIEEKKASRSAAQEPPRNPIEWKKPCLYTSGGMTVAAALVTAAAYTLAYRYSKEYTDAPEGSDFVTLKTRRDNWLNASGIALAVTCISAVGFTVAWVF